MPEGEQGMNGRAHRRPPRRPSRGNLRHEPFNRFCSSGLQARACRRTHRGRLRPKSSSPAARVHVPRAHGRQQVSPNPWLVDHYTRHLHQHGLGTKISPANSASPAEQADAFSANSHQKSSSRHRRGKKEFQGRDHPRRSKNHFHSLPKMAMAPFQVKSAPQQRKTFLFDHR